MLRNWLSTDEPPGHDINSIDAYDECERIHSLVHNLYLFGNCLNGFKNKGSAVQNFYNEARYTVPTAANLYASYLGVLCYGI